MEKAYASYVGNYDNMTAGRDSTGLRIDRTTHPPTIVLINPWGAQGSSPDNPYETRITEEQWNANFVTYSHTKVRP